MDQREAELILALRRAICVKTNVKCVCAKAPSRTPQLRMTGMFACSLACAEARAAGTHVCELRLACQRFLPTKADVPGGSVRSMYSAYKVHHVCSCHWREREAHVHWTKSEFRGRLGRQCRSEEAAESQQEQARSECKAR